MAYKKPWRVAGLLALGILVGYVVGPPIVQAASSLVTIQGGGSTHKAKVDASGRLLVNTEASVTKANQLLGTEAAPGNAVVAFGFPTCDAGGFYTIPAGKALIITGVDFYNHASGAGYSEIDLVAGPTSGPCAFLLAAGIQTDSDVSQNQSFHPGIPIPAGSSLGMLGLNQNGSAQVYGYLVPASAVPGISMEKLPRVSAGRSPTISSSR